ncbi:MAG: hypothetical protein KAV87_19920 [Desulfobacteraceae bacterium]|nr:hypothetical protein [Desulfobacteraceae bacterium]
MHTYLLKDIDEDTWSLFKAACAYHKESAKDFFLEAINLAVGEFVRSDFYKEIVKIHSEKEVDHL